MEQYLEARRKRVGAQMRSYMDNYFTFDPEYSALDEAGKDAFVARYNKKQGGRVGLANGSPHFDPPTFSEGVPQMFMSDELGALGNPKNMTTERLISVVKDGRSTPEILMELEKRIPGAIKQLKLKEGQGDSAFSVREDILSQYDPDKKAVEEDFLYDLRENIDSNYIEPRKHLPLMAQGGRIKKYGGGVTAAMPKIPTGTPRVNAGGISELDYRAKGGFVPVGVKEKADDVPAMLSKNEFVMTADAVKGAGGGNVEKGAQKMYNTMKRLEGRVA